MTPRQRIWARRGLHVLAGLLIVGGVALQALTGGAWWSRLLGEAMALLGLVWFFAPWLARIRRFVRRGRE